MLLFALVTQIFLEIVLQIIANQYALKDIIDILQLEFVYLHAKQRLVYSNTI